ncbi:hypothetical protein [Azospirillum soli]|uniref:hypothetical protein n=1 Tax=Azospirillum soli TaxID=1304799 RepID=UPI001AE73D0E|nr:hypothetical protein [Azospirillum soli]MBP2313001.1 hypothetical protein [Azospirillum soli]
MGFFSRRPSKPAPAVGLHRDSHTPIGTIWSIEASPALEEELAEGNLLDTARELSVGDLINVLAPTNRARRFTLRVTSRNDGVVHCERVR